MGAAKNRKEAFLRMHPRCIFCGGESPATTIEHCPPRAMFLHRSWPESFEFSSCELCNHGSSDDDLLVAAIARLGDFNDSSNKDGKLLGLLKQTNAQFPGLIKKMIPSSIEVRRHNRALGIDPLHGQTQQEAGPLTIPNEIHDAVCVFASKLAKAIYYREVRSIFPVEGCLLLNWFTNSDLIRAGTYPVLERLKEIGGVAPHLQRGGKYLNDQFEFKFSITDQREAFILQAVFG